MNAYTLDPSSGGTAVGIRLNSEFLRIAKANQAKPKLIVRNGQATIRFSAAEEYPCSVQNEKTAVDIYDDWKYSGSVSQKWTVITDKRLIRNHAKRTQVPVLPSPSLPQRPASALPAVRQARPKNYRLYVVGAGSDAVATLMAFVALGPATKDELVHQLQAPAEMVNSFISNYTQPYNPSDAFTGGDVFAYPASEPRHCFVLKDRAYKELRPWQNEYSDDERQTVLKNTNNALTRLGFLDTHPLRRKICERPLEGTAAPKKLALGGGLLVSKSPAKNNGTSSGTLPLKRRSDVSSSDDEERRKRKKSDSECTSPSSIDESGDDDDRQDKRVQYYTQLAAKFRAKYHEYEQLYGALKTQPKRSASDKKDLARLFEMHTTLAEWKKKLWAFDTASRSRSDIMAMAKHKKEKQPAAKKVMDY